MSNTRQDRLETASVKAIKKMQEVLYTSGLTEEQGMACLAIINAKLSDVISGYVTKAKEDEKAP